MLNYGGLGLGLIFEAKDMATGVMRTVEGGLRGLDKTATDMAASYKRALDSMRGGLAMMGAGAAALAPLIAFGKSAFGVSSTFAQTEKTFAVFTGSLANARKHISDLQVFAEQTPFDFLDLTQYSRQLQAYGFGVERVIPMLKSMGGAAAAMQDPMVLERLSRALGQMQAKGKLSGEELRQIAETGIPVYDILQKKLGLTGEQLGKAGSQGIDAGRAIGAILEGLEEKYGNMMDEFMKTPQGITSNIGDMATRIKKTIGDAFYGDITLMLQRIARAVSTLGGSGVAESFGSGFKNLVSLLRPAVDAGMGLVTAFGKLVEKQPWIGSFIVTLTGVFGVIMTVAGAVKVATGFAQVAKYWFEKWGITLDVSAGKMGRLLWPMLLVTAALTAYRYALEKNIGGLGTFWRGLGSMITNTKFDPDKGWITAIPESLKKELDKFGLTDFVTKVWMGFVRVKVAAESFGRDIGKVFARLDEATKPLRKALGDLGRAILMPFANLFKSSVESKAKGTIDSWSQMGSNLAASFERVVPFVQGFADGAAAALRGLQPVLTSVANVVVGTLKALGKVISWVFGIFGGKGEAGEGPEARMQRIGKWVGKLLVGFLAFKGVGAGFNILTGGISGAAGKLNGLANGLQNARARISSITTGINSFRANGVKAFAAVRTAPAKLAKSFGDLKGAFANVRSSMAPLRAAFRNLGQAIMGPGGRAGLARLKDGLVRVGQGFVSGSKGAWKFASDLAKSAAGAVKKFIVALAKGTVKLVTFAAKMIWAGVKAVAKFVAGLAKAIVQVVLLGAKLLWAGLKAAVSFIGGLISSAIATVASFIPAMLAAAASAWAFTVALLANPVTWIVVGIIALVAAIVLLWRNWDKVTAWVKNVWGAFTGWVSERTEGIRTAVSGAIQRMVEGITGWWDSLVIRTKIVWNNIKLTIMKGVLGIVSFLAKVPILGNMYKGVEGVVADSVASIQAELDQLNQAALGVTRIEVKPAGAAPGAAVAPLTAQDVGSSLAQAAPALDDIARGAQGAVAKSVAGMRSEFARLDQMTLGATVAEPTATDAARSAIAAPVMASQAVSPVYAGQPMPAQSAKDAAGPRTAAAPAFAPTAVRPAPVMPPIRPASASAAPAPAATAGGEEPITVKSQLILDGRVVAESVERVNRDNKARSGRW